MQRRRRGRPRRPPNPCRRSTGAPLAAYVSFPVDSFRYARGQPVIYRSSSWGRREFCGTCGAQIGYRSTEAATSTSVNTGCMDNPAAHPPRYHVFDADRLPWLLLADPLPRFPALPPDDEGT